MHRIINGLRLIMAMSIAELVKFDNTNWTIYSIIKFRIAKISRYQKSHLITSEISGLELMA